MKIKDKRLMLFLTATLAVALAACVLRAVALMTDFDYASGYYSDKGLFTASAVLAALSICIAAAHFFVGRARLDISPCFRGAEVYIPSGLLAIATVFYARELISSAFGSGAGGAGAVLLSVIAVISAIGSVCYLFLNSFLGSRYSCARGAFGISVAVFLLVCATQMYFDTAAPINAPNKSTAELAYAVAAVFLTSEIRLSLGREKWRLYIPFGLAAIAVTAYSSLPELAVYIIRAARGEDSLSLVGSSLGGSVLIFALFVFVTARIQSLVFLKNNRSGALASYTAECSARENGADALTEDNENQISIDDIMDGTADSGADGE